MRFRNAVRLTADNFTSVLKLLVYRTVVAALFFSLSYVIIRYGLAAVIDSAEMDAVVGLIKGFPSALFSGDVNELQAFQGEFHTAIVALGALVVENSASLAGAIVGVCLLYLGQRFVNGLAIFAVANTLNDRMSVYARTRFSAAFFRNLWKASLYQLLYVPMTFLYDVCSIACCWFLFFYLPSVLSITGVLAVLVALSCTVTAIVLLQALKMTLVSSWMPAIVVGKRSVTGALGGCFHGNKKTAGRFVGFLIGIYLIIAVNVLFGFVSFGGAILITVPLSYLFLLCLQFVNYYDAKGMKYFISQDKITGASGLDDGAIPIVDKQSKEETSQEEDK